MTNAAELREQVRSRYAEAASTVMTGAGAASDCCHPGTTCAEEGHATGPEFYGHLAEGQLPDVLLSAKRVGPTGKVYGLDMTEEMLALAIRNRDEAGATNVEFLKGYIEDIPLPASTVDVVISNCVVNLTTDKPRVFAEMHRVLRRGGRIGISDVAADDELDPAQRAERGSHVGCIAGALTFEEYKAELRAAGFEDVSITSTSEYLPGIHSAIVKATKPSAGVGEVGT